MDELYTFLLGEISDVSMMTEFVVMVRLIAFSLVVEALGVVCGNISSLGR